MRLILEASLLLVLTKFLLRNILDLSVVSVSFEVVTSQQWHHLMLLPHFRRELTYFEINFKMGEVGNNLHMNLNLRVREGGDLDNFRDLKNFIFHMFKYFCLVSNTTICHFVKIFAISKLKVLILMADLSGEP